MYHISWGRWDEAIKRDGPGFDLHPAIDILILSYLFLIIMSPTVYIFFIINIKYFSFFQIGPKVHVLSRDYCRVAADVKFTDPLRFWLKHNYIFIIMNEWRWCNDFTYKFSAGTQLRVWLPWADKYFLVLCCIPHLAVKALFTSSKKVVVFPF